MKWPNVRNWPGIRRLPSWLANKYVLVLIIYGVYMTFFDSNHFRSQYRRWMQVNALEKQKIYYQEQLKIVHKDYHELFNDAASIEKFAREQYFMKREGETVYVIVEE